MNQPRPEEMRALSARQIRRILSGQLGSLASWCNPADLADAVTRLHGKLPEMTKRWEVVHRSAAASRNARAGQPTKSSSGQATKN